LVLNRGGALLCVKQRVTWRAIQTNSMFREFSLQCGNIDSFTLING